MRDVRNCAAILLCISVCWAACVFGAVAYSVDTWKSAPALVLGVCGLAALLLFRATSRSRRFARAPPSHLRLSYLLLLCAVAASVFPSVLWTRSHDMVYQLLVRLACVGVIWVAAEVTSRPSRALWLGWTCAGASLVLCVLGILEYFGLALWRANTKWAGIASLCNHPNLYAGALLLLVPPGLCSMRTLPKRARQAVMPAFALMALANLAATGSRAALVAAVATMLLAFAALLAIRRRTAGVGVRRLLMAGAAVAALLAGFVSLAPAARDKLRDLNFGQETRWVPYRLAFGMWTESARTAVFGNGLGSFVSLWPSRRPSDYRSETPDRGWDAVHCEYLEILVDGGVIELSLFAVATFGLALEVRRLFRRRASPAVRWLVGGFAASVVAFLVDALFSTNARGAFLLFLLSVDVGVLAGLCRRHGTAAAEERDVGLLERLSAAVAVMAVAGSSVVFGFRLASDVLLARSTREKDAARSVALSARAAELAPRGVYPWYVLARQALYAGDAKCFGRAADAVESRVPYFKDTVLMRGVFHLGRGEWGDGACELERHLARDAGDLKARMYLLLAHLVSGDLDASLRDLAKVLEADSALRWRGVLGDSGSVRAEYHVQGSILPGVDTIRAERVGDTVHLRMGESAARQMLRSLLERPSAALNGYLFRLHYVLGRIYDLAGAPPLVVRHLAQAREHYLAGEGGAATAEDASSYAASRSILAGALLFLADQSAEAANSSEETAYLKQYLTIVSDGAIVERLMAIYRRRGEWKAMRLLREQAFVR